jgi:UDP-N-acetylmuramoyl-tripeptide--D-alanyl-D-alanine ligase
MIELAPDEAGEALGLPPLAGPVRGVSTDSRSLNPGDLFVALRGPRFDGHQFLGEAVARGAAAVVVDHLAVAAGITRGAGVPVYEVDNTTHALGALARAVRRKSGALVFAITGSAGKTSTKDLLTAMVGHVKKVVATLSNQNNEIGVPLTLLRLEPDTEAAVVEMGMRGLGEIADLAGVAEPDVGVVTNIHPVHLELLGSIENIARAKGELLGGLKPLGVAVVPGNYELLQVYLPAEAARTVTFGLASDPYRSDVEAWLEGDSGVSKGVLGVRWPEGDGVIESGYLAAHNVRNVAAAVAACYAARLCVQECLEGLAEAEFSEGRGQIVELPGLVLVDDTYNANPAAVRAALGNLARVAAERGGEAVAVLGDMLELGPESARFHREVGVYAAEVGVRALWGVGAESRETVRGFQDSWEAKHGADKACPAGHVGSPAESSRVFKGLRPGDVVLFKASRGVHLESMLQELVDVWKAETRENE